MGIALDPSERKLYWSAGCLHRSNLDGGNIETVACGNLIVQGLCFDGVNGVLYWTSDFTDGVGKTDPGQNDLTLLIAGTRTPDGLALDSKNGMVYWVDSQSWIIHRCDMQGMRAEVLISDVRKPRDIALDLQNDKMYWVAEWDSSIQRANLDGSSIEIVLDGKTSGIQPRSLALDVTGNRMFFLDIATSAIYRSALDGSNPQPLCAVIGAPGEIALDLDNEHIYWTAGTMVCRANLDGSSSIILLVLVEPAGLALDVENGHIYWVDHTANKLQRANLDGSNVQDIIEVIYRPNSLAIQFE
jgi:low density lipoprotein receptor-related protein 5/6